MRTEEAVPPALLVKECQEVIKAHNALDGYAKFCAYGLDGAHDGESAILA